MFSYFFWISATHIVSAKLEDILSSHISNLSFVGIELLGLFIVILIGNINWKKILKI
jgi:hypothetical protein